MDNIEIDEALIKIISGQFDPGIVTKLSFNGLGVSRIQSLSCAPMVHTLDLSNNKIGSLNGLNALTDTLVNLNLAHNSISQLAPLKELPKLQRLTLTGNYVSELEELWHLTSLPQLRAIHFQNHDGSASNPICDNPQYKNTLINKLKTLICLDGKYFLKGGLNPEDCKALVESAELEIELPPPKEWLPASYWTTTSVDPKVVINTQTENDFKVRLVDTQKLAHRADELIEAAKKSLL
eukprot:TRINITY_DN56646_c0_g1_i1.p1 TRINITY_DN56646_c0_g1~~TRINITY_DN56646_c0_g1_i1.p1  ORF type:complete len:237 (-),score=4.65 TRINITY_DN56646_c0_g1_i1:79-789(-)